MVTLAEADRIRRSERARALDIYAELQAEIAPDDAERILWICEQVAPTPPAALEPLLERAVEQGNALVQRAAVHGLATIAWFGGRPRDAERLWRRGLEGPDAAHDRFWIRSCLNLATVMGDRECTFEALVLTGMGKRAALAAGLPYLTTFAAIRRAQLLIIMDDLDRAELELLDAAAHIDDVHRDAERRVVRYEFLSARSHLRERQGDLPAALAVRDSQLEFLETYGHVEDAILHAVQIERLRLAFGIEPQGRAAVLAELAEIPSRYELGPAHHVDWQRVHAELSMRAAIDEGRSDDAMAHARTLLGILGASLPDSERVLPAGRLGRVFAEELNAPEDAQAAFDLGSTACLRRLVEAHRATREIPELGEPTDDDRGALAEYRERLARDQAQLLKAVADSLKPGAPAFDLLVESEAVRICAWCQRVRTTDDEWLPVAHYIPATRDLLVTHGICPSCMDAMFAG